jgi:hypothetical protein
MRIRDPGWKKFGTGIRGWKKVGSGIRDKRPGSATLHLLLIVLTFGILRPVLFFLHLLDGIIIYLL